MDRAWSGTRIVPTNTDAPLRRRLEQRRLTWINDQHAWRGIQMSVHRRRGEKVLSIAIMLLLLIGFYGLFAGLVSFSEGVIEPDSTS
jgi:hypothetical protein